MGALLAYFEVQFKKELVNKNKKETR